MSKLFTKQAAIGLAAGIMATFLPVIYYEVQALRLNGSFIYPVDDAFIHMELAKNLAFHGNWGINSHEFGAASSSILYTVILATLTKIFSASMFLPLLVNCVAALFLLYFVNRWLVKQQLTLAGHVLVMLAVVFFTPLPIMIISGMEHTLQCLFIFLFLFHGAEWAAREKNLGKKSWHIPWQLPVYGMLLTAIRYEGLFPVFIFCVALLYLRQIRASIIIGAIGLLPVVLFGLYSISKGSFFLPNSVLIKSEEVSLFGGGISHFFTTLFVDKFTLMKPGITLLATQRLLLIVSLVYLFFTRRAGLSWYYRFILIILFGSILLHLALAATGKFYRYEAYLIFTTALITGTILVKNSREVYHDISLASKAFALAVIIFLLLPVVLRSTAAFSKARQAFINIYEQQYQMAGFVQRFYPASTIAANDIGAVSFFSNGEVVDLWGLGSIDIARSRKENYWTAAFIDSFVKKQNTTLAIIYDSWFHPSPGTFWTKIGTWQISNNVVCGDDLVSFYAVDAAAADELRKNFRWYSEHQLPRTVMVKYY
jgi:hypothetical protein